MGIFNLDQPMAPRFIKALYVIAVVLIGLGMLRGVITGTGMIIHPRPPLAARDIVPPPPPGPAASAQPNADTSAPAGTADANTTPPAAAPTAPQAGVPGTQAQAGGLGRGRRFMMRGDGNGARFMGPGMMRGRRMGPGMMNGFGFNRFGGGPVGGILRIAFALVRGIVLIMILRILSEVGLAVLSANQRLGQITPK